MFSILYRRQARALGNRRLLADEAAVGHGGAVVVRERSQDDDLSGRQHDAARARNAQRRRYRSRNCSTFRRYGPYFQFVDPETDLECGTLRRGRSFMGGRARHVRENELLGQLEQMQSQVERLLQHREMLAARMINTRAHLEGQAIDMTRRFYDFFRHGFDPVNHPVRSRDAEAFLRAAMLEDCVCTEFTGVDLFLQQYREGTENHASFTVDLKGVSLLQNSDADSIQVKAEATARFRISRETLIRFFPNIIQDEELTQQLIGKEYEMQYDKVFHFAGGRIYQHESRIDMCSGLLRMVGDPFLAMKLFQASLLTKHGHWKIDNQIAEDRHQLENSAL